MIESTTRKQIVELLTKYSTQDVVDEQVSQLPSGACIAHEGLVTGTLIDEIERLVWRERIKAENAVLGKLNRLVLELMDLARVPVLGDDDE